MAESRLGSQPFNAPQAAPELVEMWRSVLRKAQRPETDTLPPVPQAGAVIINFDGAGQPLTAGMGGIPEIPPGAWRIVGCHMAAGMYDVNSLRIVPVAVSASVNLQLASHGSWQGGSRSLWANTMPTLTAQAEADIDLSGWITDLQPGDSIPYALATFTGSATVLTLTLTLRRLDVTGINAAPVTDDTGAIFTDSNGAAFVIRS